jgi:hypothetical protein
MSQSCSPARMRTRSGSASTNSVIGEFSGDTVPPQDSIPGSSPDVIQWPSPDAATSESASAGA